MAQHSKRIRQLFVLVVVLGSAAYYGIVVLQQTFWTMAPPTMDAGILPSTGHDVLSSTSLLDVKNHPEKNQEDDDVTICFLVSVYGKWASHADQLQNVEKLRQTFFSVNDTTTVDSNSSSQQQQSSSTSSTAASATTTTIKKNNTNNNNYTDKVHFLVFTNMPGLKATGWTKIVRPYPQYQRYITQSRHPKFLGWNDSAVKERNCQVIFYQDAIGHIIGNYSYFQQTAKAILASDVGHAQYLHRGGNGAYGEFRRIEVFQKDSLENIQKSKAWLEAQPDFRPYDCPLYENRYIGYATQSDSFRKASLFLWQRYSQELDSFRDQPLWCYTLDHFNITPIPLDHKQLWKLKTRRMGKHGHKYADLPSVDMGPKPGGLAKKNTSSTGGKNN